MAGLRGYPQPGYKAAARDFQQSPPLSPKRAPPVSAGDPVDAQLLQEIISGTAYSRKEQLLLEVIEVAAETLEREAPIAAKALRVPARFMPWLNAFMIGYDVANAGIDIFQYYTREVPNPNNTNGGGGYVAHSTINEDFPVDNPINNPTYGVSISENNLPSMNGTFGSGSYPKEVYWYWWAAELPHANSFFSYTLFGDLAGGAGATLDPIIQTLPLAVEPAPATIPYKLIPYLHPDPTPTADDPRTQVQSGWYMTNGPTPPDTTGFRDTPGVERKPQLTGKGAAAMRVVKALINAATETCDAVEAIYNAIPESARIGYGFQYEKRIYKRAVSTVPGTKGKIIRDASGAPVVEKSYLSRISCTRMAKVLAQRTVDKLEIVDLVDWDKAINNLIVNQIEDAVFGFAGSKANDAFVNTPGYSRPFGLGLGKVF